MSAAELPTWVRAVLRCPEDKGLLTDTTGPDASPELVCAVCHRAYPVRDGIPVLLVDDARRA